MMAERHAPRIVAIDLTPVLPGGDNGGAKIFVLDLVRRLAEQHPATHFSLLTASRSHDEMASLEQSNVTRHLVVTEGRGAGNTGRLRSLLQRVSRPVPDRISRKLMRAAYSAFTRLRRHTARKAIQKIPYDVLFCPFTAPTFARPGAPVVSTIYDFQYHAYPEFFSPEDVLHRQQTFQAACDQACFLAAISDYSRDQALMIGGLDPQRVVTIRLNLAARVTKKGDNTLPAGLPVSAGRYLLYPANFWRHKNHELLLTAFSIACRRSLAPDMKLVLTGAPGERQNYIATCASKLGIADRVVIPGFLDEADFTALLRASCGVIFPSLYEGFGLPVIEAMAAGVPVACSRATALPEIAGHAAIYFDQRRPADVAEAILTMASPEFDRVAAIARGVQQAALFLDGNTMADAYWQLFLKAHGHGAPA